MDMNYLNVAQRGRKSDHDQKLGMVLRRNGIIVSVRTSERRPGWTKRPL
jgi:hypothetical protein